MQNQTTAKPDEQTRKQENEGLNGFPFARNDKGNEQHDEQPSPRKYNREDGRAAKHSQREH